MGPVLNLRNRAIFKVIISVSPQFSVSISYKYISSFLQMLYLLEVEESPVPVCLAKLEATPSSRSVNIG